MNQKILFTFQLIMIIIYNKNALLTVKEHHMIHIQKFVDNNQRMFKKTFSYYIMHISIAMLVGYFVTGSWAMAIALSLLEPTVQAVAFFFHEKFWEQKPQPSAQDLKV